MRPLPLSPTHQVRIGSRLRAARKAHGYTLEQLASASGLTKGFLSRVERDETSPSVASLLTLCEVMSVDVGSLFSAPDVALVRRNAAPAINLGCTGVTEQLMTPVREALPTRAQLTAAAGNSLDGAERLAAGAVGTYADLIVTHPRPR